MAWPVFRLSVILLYRRIGIFLIGNVFWLLVSLPIVTMPAATAALFHLTQRILAEERDLDLILATREHFWEGWQLHWRRATIVGYINFAVFLLLIITVRFYWITPAEQIGWLAGPVFMLLLVFMGMQLYLFPALLHYPDDRAWQLFRRAFFLTLSHPFDTLMLIIWLTLVAILSTILAGPVFLVLFSFFAIVRSMALRFIRIQRREIPPAKADIPEAER
ncbi:MAG: DUF624 domain-containing protein [Chloroflexota bacterium]